jgi:serine O-acetyltransferase
MFGIQGKKSMWGIIKRDLLAAGAKNNSFKIFLIYYLTHPEFKTVFWYRISASFYKKGGISKFIGKLLWVRLVKISGCYISLKAKIGAGLKLPHATGVVIGDDVVIGDNVQIYQHVTIGRKSIIQDDYPVIGDNVIIYAGAVLIGNIVIGNNAVIGANSVLTQNVNESEVFVGIPAKKINN